MAKKTIVRTDNAPQAIGPYSQGVGFGNLFFFSGQVPIDPDTGDVVEGDIERQTRQVMANLDSVLEASGLEFSHVLRTTIYLADMDDYSTVNEIYGEFFDDNPPARACVEVSRLPKDVGVEIDMIAAHPPEDRDENEEEPADVEEEVEA